MTKSKEMNDLSEIGQVLEEADSVLIFPHGSIDGDALGSAVALCLALREADKTSYVMMDEKIPDNLQFLEYDCCNWNLDTVLNPDVCVCLDNGDINRLYDRQDLFKSGRTKVLIDHHKSSQPFLDYNYIDETAAASAEIVFDLIQSMGLRMNSEIAEAIYVGIVTDTGRFQYSNTSKRTHEIVAQLMDYSIDQNKVSVEIFQSISEAKMKLQVLIQGTLKLKCNGKLAIAYMTRNMVDSSGAKDDDSEGMVEILRSIKGVEVALFAKESEKDGIKVSMRSKFNVDVSKIAQTFDGGGHRKAAGFRSDGNLEDVISKTVKKIENVMI